MSGVPAPTHGEASDVEPTDDETVVECRNVTKQFARPRGLLSTILRKPRQADNAINGVDIRVRAREVVGLVGESGSGKSTLGMAMVRLHDVTGGRIFLGSRDITNISGAELKRFRRDAQIIFQDPYGSLNPRLTVGQIVEEPLIVHGMKNSAERHTKVVETLLKVKVSAEQYINRLPHELSGGLRQRIAIARAVVLNPKFIVADEPVSMLDVSVQAGVLGLLAGLARESDVGILYISHDIATVRYICDRVAVMYKGRIVELGRTDDVIAAPKHQYTQRLMAAVPSPDPSERRPRVGVDDLFARPDALHDGNENGGPDLCVDPKGDLVAVGQEHYVVCPRHDAS